MRTFAAVTVTASTVSAASVTPVQKVITLMTDMRQTGQTELNAEENRMSVFNQWCTDTTTKRQTMIDENNDLINENNALSETAAANIASCTERINTLTDDVARWKGDISASTRVNKLEKADHAATKKDLTETIDAVTRALEVMKNYEKTANRQDVDNAARDAEGRAVDAVLFLQKSLTTVDFAIVSRLKDVYDKAGDGMGYQQSSGSVTDMLLDLKKKFIKELRDEVTSRTAEQHSFEAVLQKLTDNVNNANAEIDTQTAERASNEQDKADADNIVKRETSEKKGNTKSKLDTESLCAQKQKDWEARKVCRTDEITALDTVLEVMGSKAVTGNADKHLPALNQKNVSLLQVSSTKKKTLNVVQEKVASLLQNRAEKYKSKVLSMLAMHASADPFAKVKDMILKMIWSLKEEATAETEHKGWCDAELLTNRQHLKQRRHTKRTLTTEIDSLTNSISELSEKIKSLTEEIAEATDSLAKATKARNEEKAVNAATVKDANESQAAIESVQMTLKQYYFANADNTSLIQQPFNDVAPDTFNTPCRGQQEAFGQSSENGEKSSTGGVAALLDVIMSDFVRLQTDTEAAEESADSAFKQYAEDTRVSMAEMTAHKEFAQNTKAQKEDELASRQGELADNEKLLNESLEQEKSLHPVCVATGATYEERVAKREAEIQSLNEAAAILKDSPGFD